MKYLLAAALATVLLFAGNTTASAQGISVTQVGTSTTGSTMPGNPYDFIFFNSADYPFNGPVQGNGTSSYVDLTNFTIAGGLQGGGPFNGDSTITTPAGVSLETGFIASTASTFAFAIEPVGITSSNYQLYNDFNVFVMYGNSDGTLDDSTISLSPRSSDESGGDFSGGPLTTVDVTDSGTATTAKFLDFEVKGLGTEFINGDAPDLVLSGSGAHGETGVGGVAFDIPEPSTYALMGLGMAGLFFLGRFFRLSRSA
jgi:hypothetical protein